MNPSTKVRATLFAGALTIACGIVLVSKGTDWFRPLKIERKKSCSREDNTSSNDDKRDKSDPHSCVEAADDGRYDGSSDGALPHSQVSPMVERKPPVPLEPTNITAVTSIGSPPCKCELGGSAGLADAIPPPSRHDYQECEGCQPPQKDSCQGLQELCSMLDAPPVAESIATRIIPQPRVQQTPPSLVDLPAVTEGGPEVAAEEASSVEPAQASDSGVGSSVPVQDGSASSVSSPPAERRALNPLATPFMPRGRLDPNAAPFQPGRRRLNPNAARFHPS